MPIRACRNLLLLCPVPVLAESPLNGENNHRVGISPGYIYSCQYAKGSVPAVNQFQRVVWLARRNFVRGTFSNLATIFLVSVNCLVFFIWYLHKFAANPALASDTSAFLALSELLLIVLLVMNFFSLLVIFWLINKVRYHEIGLLRGIGARRSFIFKLLLVETQFIVLSSGVLAILLGVLFVKTQGQVLAPFFAPVGLGTLLLAGGAALGSTMVAATLAALYPAIVICSVEPYTAIRNRE